jgi:hypothetical protein
MFSDNLFSGDVNLQTEESEENNVKKDKKELMK